MFFLNGIWTIFELRIGGINLSLNLVVIVTGVRWTCPLALVPPTVDDDGPDVSPPGPEKDAWAGRRCG